MTLSPCDRPGDLGWFDHQGLVIAVASSSDSSIHEGPQSFGGYKIVLINLLANLIDGESVWTLQVSWHACLIAKELQDINTDVTSQSKVKNVRDPTRSSN